jgi:hypothetical protein
MMVKAEANEPEALLAAMKAGRFYSTQGPELLSVEIGEGKVAIACSPVTNIAVVGRGTRAVHRYEAGMTGAELPLERFAGDWCRVVVTDSAGRSAWTNPVRV